MDTAGRLSSSSRNWNAWRRWGSPGRSFSRWSGSTGISPNVRRRVISRLLEGKQYSEAASLLRESKELDRKWPGLVSGYSQALIGLYEETGQTEKLLDELQFQVFQCGQHDLAYVKKLKEQTSTSRWPELRERLLAGKTPPGDLREAFLAQEGLYARLMDRVAALESLQTLDRWEDVLRLRFPERMRDAYIQCLDARMRLASDRKQYAAAISYLKNSGHTQAAWMRRWHSGGGAPIPGGAVCWMSWGKRGIEAAENDKRM